jgi:uncharacterized MAPEG superfamily protein
MSKELYWLVLTAAMTGLLWVPYILDRIMVRGLMGATANPSPTDKPQSAWAQRMNAAHANTVENLVVFAPLVLVAQAAGVHAPAIATAACGYFWARVVHAAAYTLAVPWVRTLAFVAGVAMQLWIAVTLLKG